MARKLTTDSHNTGLRISLLRSASLAAVCLAAGLLTACNSTTPTDQQVQQAAARATVDAKQGAKQAVVAAQAAAVVATRQVDNLAAGVREGMKEKTPLIDINSASRITIATLPGISLARAGAIVDGRPYASGHQLVSKGLISSSEYARIAPKIEVK